jgi:GT2 family glycosyltransferase
MSIPNQKKPDICVSIIIPFQKVTAYLHETLQHIAALEGQSFEVILLPDQKLNSSEINTYHFETQILPTGAVSPAIKRDIGAKHSNGEFLAFIDDDAYPSADWLSKVIDLFDDDTVTAVGGPQITPDSNSFWQQVSGAIFLSCLNGRVVWRYWPATKGFDVDDWPSVNLVVRKKDFFSVGGFDSAYWPGEDTKLCHDLIGARKNNRIVYEPAARVFHHRRAGIGKHLKQIGNYGLHRGFFAKKFPKTSFKPVYFAPSCFFTFALFGWLSLYSYPLSNLFYVGWILYGLAIIASTWSIYHKIKKISVATATIPFMIVTHFWYGARFLQGFVFTKDLTSKLGR